MQEGAGGCQKGLSLKLCGVHKKFSPSSVIHTGPGTKVDSFSALKQGMASTACAVFHFPTAMIAVNSKVRHKHFLLPMTGN